MDLEPQMPTTDRKRARLDVTEAGVSVLLLAVLSAGFAALVIPGARELVPPCLFYETTGLHCPGCGSTRAATALLHGDLLTALRMNPLAVLLGPLLGYALARDALESMGLARLPKLPMTAAVAWTAAIVVLAYWVLRNVPVAPFAWLAPG